jgi:hypothetical protein
MGELSFVPRTRAGVFWDPCMAMGSEGVNSSGKGEKVGLTGRVFVSGVVAAGMEAEAGTTSVLAEE